MSTLENKKESLTNASYFIGITLAVFAITYTGLYFIGWVPASLGGPEKISQIDENYWLGEYDIVDPYDDSKTNSTRPSRIIIDKVGVDTIVEQPKTRDVTILDQYLTRGAVYYPGSGTIENGNMFVFGHSTGLSVVQNQAYKTFNNIENLVKGDDIRVEADGKTFIYKVTSVKLFNEDDALITFDNSKRKLTISTCNTFGAKQERWVVEAEFHKKV